MWDLKSPKAGKLKSNRRKKERAPLDWKKIFRVGLRVGAGLASLGLVTSGGLLAMRLLFASDFFRIESVRVENNQRVGAEEVIALSDVRPGMNIFEIDLEAIGRKIEEEPWIATARVDRVFPREVVIRITEHEPRAVINLGYLYYVDGTGEVFKTLEPQDKLDFPMVTGVDRKFLLEKPEEARRLLAEAMGLLRELAGRRKFGLEKVSELNIDPAEGYILTTLVGGIPVRMGFSNFADKLDHLEQVYPELEPNLSVLRYIDLNVADRVIVRVDRKIAAATEKTAGRG